MITTQSYPTPRDGDAYSAGYLNSNKMTRGYWIIQVRVKSYLREDRETNQVSWFLAADLKVKLAEIKFYLVNFLVLS